MQEFPHHYAASATANPSDEVALESAGLPRLASAAPAEFGGPGGRWSPETLLVAAVADCFVLGFRAIAHASKFEWLSVQCDVEGTLDRIERVTQFTGFTIRARLQVAAGTDDAKAVRMLERAEKACLITNSLKAEPRLETSVEFVA